MFEGKKVAILGDRDGIPGPAIKECIETTDAEVVFTTTECFVWTSAGAMDLENQARIKELAEEHGKENLMVILGGAEAEASGLACETVTNGDPTFAGPLAGVQLGLACYHVLEPEVKNEIDDEVYEGQISMMEMVLEVEDIIGETKKYREKYSIYN